MKSEIIKITPELAESYLEHNIKENRTIRQSTVSKYAKDMRSGKWKLTHQGIAFDDLGQLIDGQHRLWAIIESNTPVEMMVTTDIPSSDVSVVDGGLSRTLADQMKFISDDPMYRSQTVLSFIRRFLILKMKYPRKYKFSITEIVKFIDEHYYIIKYVYDLSKGNLHLRNSAFYSSMVSCLAHGYTVDDINAFVYCAGSAKFTEGYNNAAAIKFRYWYDSDARKTNNNLTEGESIVANAEKAVYLFCSNATRVKNFKVFDVDFESLNKTEEMLKEYYNSRMEMVIEY